MPKDFWGFFVFCFAAVCFHLRWMLEHIYSLPPPTSVFSSLGILPNSILGFPTACHHNVRYKLKHSSPSQFNGHRTCKEGSSKSPQRKDGDNKGPHESYPASFQGHSSAFQPCLIDKCLDKLQCDMIRHFDGIKNFLQVSLTSLMWKQLKITYCCRGVDDGEVVAILECSSNSCSTHSKNQDLALKLKSNHKYMFRSVCVCVKWSYELMTSSKMFYC